MKRLACVPIILIMGVLLFSAGVVVASETGITLVGEDELEAYNLETPGKRIDTVYKQGDDKVFIECSDVVLVPVGDGDSMWPMITEGHLILATTDYEFGDIQIGDFIVVDGLGGRYFHQVVGINGSALTSRGINNTADDIFPVFPEDIVGVAIAVIW